MCYTFNVAKWDKIFDYLFQEKKIKLQVVMSYHRRNSSRSMHIVNGIILILMLLTIATFSVDRFNQP
jgi:hypothetical protein